VVGLGRRARALDHGVGQAADAVIDRHDQLADHAPVRKGQEPLATIDPAACNTAGQEGLVHGTDVAQHVPDVLRVGIHGVPQVAVLTGGAGCGKSSAVSLEPGTGISLGTAR
jgi:hypothetical protein